MGSDWRGDCGDQTCDLGEAANALVVHSARASRRIVRCAHIAIVRRAGSIVAYAVGLDARADDDELRHPLHIKPPASLVDEQQRGDVG